MSDDVETHVDSGKRCLVAHFSDNDFITMLLQCIICKKCGQHIRPENMNEECKWRVEKVIKEYFDKVLPEYPKSMECYECKEDVFYCGTWISKIEDNKVFLICQNCYSKEHEQ